MESDPAPVALDPAALLFDFVQDRTELAYEERTAYYGILDHVRRVPPAELERAAADFVHRRWSESRDLRTPEEEDFPIFADMLKRPAEYRGQPILLRGHVIRSVKYSGDNAYDPDSLYEAWLVTPDSQQHPVTIVFTELPAGLTLGEDSVDGVTVSGYFLKLHLYASRDNKGRVAPLILARTIRISGPPTMALPLPPWVIYAVILALIAAVAFYVWRSNRGDREFQKQLRARRNESPQAGMIQPGPAEWPDGSDLQ
jgi:hypothetical protein